MAPSRREIVHAPALTSKSAMANSPHGVSVGAGASVGVLVGVTVGVSVGVAVNVAQTAWHCPLHDTTARLGEQVLALKSEQPPVKAHVLVQKESQVKLGTIEH